MKNLIKGLAQRIRELLYLLVSLPITIFLFSIVVIGLSTGGFLPISVLVFLFLLTFMEAIARFEIKRTNRMLRTDFQIIDNWFSYPFASWDGVKERVTSSRSWMAITYVFLAFFWSLVGFTMAIIGIAGVLGILLSLGLIAFLNFNKSFVFTDNGETISGSFHISHINSPFLEFTFDDNGSTGKFAWSLQSWPAIVASLILILLSIWLIPRIARINAKLVESLLSGTALPELEAKFKKYFGGKKVSVSERQVREAMQTEQIREELSELSNRERQILALMAQGKTNAGIAKTLYINEGSVEKHISNILNKLGINGGEDTHRRVTAVLKYLGISQNND
jgi:DNA-binding CsgD family transcriptional regulator